MNGTVTVQDNAYEMCTQSRCLLTLTEETVYQNSITNGTKILCQR